MVKLWHKNYNLRRTQSLVPLITIYICKRKVCFCTPRKKKNGKERVRRSSLQHFLIPMPIIYFNLTSIRLARAIQKFRLTSIVIIFLSSLTFEYSLTFGWFRIHDAIQKSKIALWDVHFYVPTFIWLIIFIIFLGTVINTYYGEFFQSY